MIISVKYFINYKIKRNKTNKFIINLSAITTIIGTI